MVTEQKRKITRSWDVLTKLTLAVDNTTNALTIFHPIPKNTVSKILDCSLGSYSIKSHENNFNKINRYRSHCDCDIDFYNCLKEADSLVSKKIGFTYFTILGPQCFKEERIITACLKEEQ